MPFTDAGEAYMNHAGSGGAGADGSPERESKLQDAELNALKAGAYYARINLDNISAELIKAKNKVAELQELRDKAARDYEVLRKYENG